MVKKLKIKTPKKRERPKFSFKGIILNNFKGYGQKTNIDLCPGVNLIYGKNSAGKSSVIQALRLIRQSLLVTNSHIPLVPLSPIHMNLIGKIPFPEGFEGILYAKDTTRIMNLGLEVIAERDKELNSRTLVYGFASNKKDDQFPDLKSIEMKRKEGSFEKMEEKDKLLLELGKKNRFKEKSNFARWLEKLSNFVGPFAYGDLDSNAMLGWRFRDTKLEQLITSEYFYEMASIKEFNLDRIDRVFKQIQKNPNKNLKTINSFFNNNFLKKNIKKVDKESKSKERLSLRSMNIGHIFAEIKKIKRLHKFINSPDFLDKEKFSKFFKEDIISSSNILRFQDQLVDRNVYDPALNIKKGNRRRFFGFMTPDIYFLNILEKAMETTVAPGFRRYFHFHHMYQRYLSYMRRQLETVTVVPGLRQLPERYHKRGLSTSYVGQAGENIGELIHDERVRNRVNEWFKLLEIPYEIRSTLKDNYYYITMRPSGEKYFISYRDVGLGYSLSLAFLLTCLLEENKTILVEEPEIHLHPKLQADVMDLLLYSSIERGNQFIVETHSENLLLRGQKCIRQGYSKLKGSKKSIPVTSKNLGINNIYREKNTSNVQKIEIDNKGEFRTHWRDGFFAEKLDDLF